MSQLVDPIERGLRAHQLQLEREEAERIALENERDDWTWLMSSDRGRRIVRSLIRDRDESDFSPNFGVMSFKAGFNHFLQSRVVGPAKQSCLDLFHLMEREENDERNAERNP